MTRDRATRPALTHSGDRYPPPASIAVPPSQGPAAAPTSNSHRRAGGRSLDASGLDTQAGYALSADDATDKGDPGGGGDGEGGAAGVLGVTDVDGGVVGGDL
jgi:hypothetical protein